MIYLFSQAKYQIGINTHVQISSLQGAIRECIVTAKVKATQAPDGRTVGSRGPSSFRRLESEDCPVLREEALTAVGMR